MRFDYIIVLLCFVLSVYLVFHLPLQGQRYSIMGLISKLSERICELGKTSGTFLDCSSPMGRDLSHSHWQCLNDFRSDLLTMVFHSHRIRYSILAIGLWAYHKYLKIGIFILLFLVLALRAPANPPQHLRPSDAVPHACRCRPCTYNRGRAFQSSTI